MVFRAAAGITTLLIGLNSQAVAQYYPSPQAYPRQPLPPAVSTEELPPLNAPVVRGDALSPPVGVGPAYQPAPDTVPLPPTGNPPYLKVVRTLRAPGPHCACSPGQPEAAPGYLYGLERCHTIAPCHNSIRYIGTRPRARGGMREPVSARRQLIAWRKPIS